MISHDGIMVQSPSNSEQEGPKQGGNLRTVPLKIHVSELRQSSAMAKSRHLALT